MYGYWIYVLAQYWQVAIMPNASVQCTRIVYDVCTTTLHAEPLNIKP